jgi:hypothetical protein
MNNAINYILSNETIMTFLKSEARKQVASDIRAKTGSGTTEKGVEVLLINGNDKTIAVRFESYLAAGIAACVKLRIESAK